ncbi:MAG TPA: DUF308 domain-containing protein, partial [Cyclobacteriaceae bacterium]|nr:DUF308 domain-containing protein [Cyclobacteriaceae bacterium]
ILFIITGIWVLRTPVESFLALSVLFSVTFLVNGFFEIVYSVSNRKKMDNWGWVLAGGIVDLLFGFWLMSSPIVSVAVLPFYVGFLLMFRAISAIGFAIDLQSFGVNEWGWLLTLGILGLFFSFILLWNPLLAGLTAVIWTAAAFISIGIFRIWLSFKLKGLHTISKKLPTI